MLVRPSTYLVTPPQYLSVLYLHSVLVSNPSRLRLAKYRSLAMKMARAET